jgi:hypothetical protein
MELEVADADTDAVAVATISKPGLRLGVCFER